MKNLARYVTAILAAGFMLAACAQLGFPAPKTPAQAVYAAKGAFLATVLIANQYKALPPCGGTSVLCSSPSVVTKLRLAANAGKATLDSAEATVTDPAFKGSTTDAAVVAAENAVEAFSTIANELKVQ